MKKFFIYAVLWVLVSIIWYALKSFTEGFVEIWYIKTIYAAVGIGIVFLGGDAICKKWVPKDEE